MAGPTNDAFADIVNLLAAPIASGIRAADQFRHGIDELIRAVENMNRTMDNLNEAAGRVNALLAEVEEPVRAMIPQLTRTIDAADSITRALEAPVRRAAPNLDRIVDTLSSPAFTSLPSQLGEVLTRLAPLTGLAGGLRIPGFGTKPAEPIPPAGTAKAAKQAAAKKPAAKKSPAKKPPR
ncbi:MAG TPA: hypothetical protein VNQ73_14705 [Ilumatobacter sp.]|nr:hypothetical protein [Ilumatobacter sp.]